MSEQEKIREITASRFWYLASLPGMNIKWEELTPFAKECWFHLADDFLLKLHSQGVVIKVDRELPTCPCECCKHEDVKADDDFCFMREDCGKDYKKWELAGYVAVEPLIKEGE